MVQVALIAFGLVILGLLAVAALRPATFRVARSVIVRAEPQAVQDLIVDFRAWSRWSPYEGLDPAMSRTYEGEARGVGAIYGWSGNGKAGSGRMEVVEVSDRRVAIRLDFLKPFEAHNLALFTLEPEGDGYRLTWAMEGPAPFMTRLMGLVFNMDRMVGRDFETGLANLKAVVEG